MTDTTKIEASHERLVIELHHCGIFHIDPEQGVIWRTGELRRFDFRPVRRRRAEYRSTNGYLRLRVMYQGIRFRVSAHRVIYRFFHGSIPEGTVIDHINEDRTDNRASNLEAITQRENTLRSLIRRRRKRKAA